MREIKIITVPFDSQNGIFDDEGLQAYLRRREVLHAEPKFFEKEGRAYWSVYLETRVLQGAVVPAKVDDSRREKNSEEMAFRQLLKELDEIESVRYRSLVQWRREKAHEEGVPPYVILTNRQCLDIARGVPRTLEGLGQVKGVGKKRIKKHGRLILEVLHGKHPETAGPRSSFVRRVD